LCLSRWLGGGLWRGCGRLHHGSTRVGLYHRLRDGLSVLAGGDRNTTCHNCGGGDAESRACNEIAAGYNWSSALAAFTGFYTRRLGWLLACRTVVFRHQTSPFPGAPAPG